MLSCWGKFWPCKICLLSYYYRFARKQGKEKCPDGLGPVDLAYGLVNMMYCLHYKWSWNLVLSLWILGNSTILNWTSMFQFRASWGWTCPMCQWFWMFCPGNVWQSLDIPCKTCVTGPSLHSSYPSPFNGEKSACNQDCQYLLDTICSVLHLHYKHVLLYKVCRHKM